MAAKGSAECMHPPLSHCSIDQKTDRQLGYRDVSCVPNESSLQFVRELKGRVAA